MKRAPDCIVPRWARIYGLSISAMEDVISQYRPSDRLPRGMEKRIANLRLRIIGKIRSLTSGISK